MQQNLPLDSMNDAPRDPPFDEEICVEQARRGDGAAFARLFSRYNAPICTYLARLLGNDELGRDLAQETFIRAWKSLPTLSGSLQFRPWLYRIATNLARSQRRHERLISWLPWREQVRPDQQPSLWIEGPEARVGESELVLHILTCLSRQTRTCLLLQLHAGFSQREIAETLHISEKSVSAYISRGREQFRRLYLQAKGDTAQ